MKLGSIRRKLQPSSVDHDGERYYDSNATTPYQTYEDPLEQPPVVVAAIKNDSSNNTISSSPAHNRPYRGFSTSIVGSFTSVENERVDCCSLACFGILQSDRDRYLLTGTRPPTLARRVWLHVMIPCLLFGIAGFCAFHIPSIYWNQLACTALVTMLIAYLLSQCCKGRWKRIGVRRELLWRLSQMDRTRRTTTTTRTTTGTATNGGEEGEPQSSYEDAAALVPPAYITNGEEDDEGHDVSYMNGQSQRDLICAHRLVGFYATDLLPTQEEQDKKESSSNNLCSCLWQSFYVSLCCCNPVRHGRRVGGGCGYFLQLCGMCALAQEARELEQLLPASRRRMDYVSMQPMMQYYPSILELRQNKNTSLVAHYRQGLSLLSRWLLQYLAVVLGLLLVISLLPRVYFAWQNYLVLLATFGQAFVLLYFVHWQWNKFDLSLDAVIKYFACGFLLSTMLAVGFETLVGLILRGILTIFLALSGVDVATNNDFQNKKDGAFQTVGIGQQQHGGGAFLDGNGPGAAVSSDKSYLAEFGRDHPFVMAILLLIQSYILAALIEELCKYFGYRMVDHPDFLSKEELEEAVDAPILKDDEVEVKQQGGENNNENITINQDNNASSPDFSAQKRSLCSLGAGITVAMVSVALGFACCENLIYVFVYNESSFDMEITVLIARSLFPIHPIAAAIQSIGVVKRDLEGDKNHKLGRIILPALILHGTFDYILLLLDFLSSIGDENGVIDEHKAAVLAIVSFILSFVIVALALAYYIRESQKQHKRLERLDNNLIENRADGELRIV